MGMKKGQKQYGKEFTRQVMEMHYEQGKTIREIAEFFKLDKKRL